VLAGDLGRGQASGPGGADEDCHLRVNPIQALVFAAVFNGIAAVPLIWFISRLAPCHDVMGAARSGWLSRVLLAVTFIGMAASIIAMAASYMTS
jgi:Mn2+/Fe2+ NRAMP family transporter